METQLSETPTRAVLPRSNGRATRPPIVKAQLSFYRFNASASPVKSPPAVYPLERGITPCRNVKVVFSGLQSSPVRLPTLHDAFVKDKAGIIQVRLSLVVAVGNKRYNEIYLCQSLYNVIVQKKKRRHECLLALLDEFLIRPYGQSTERLNYASSVSRAKNSRARLKTTVSARRGTSKLNGERCSYKSGGTGQVYRAEIRTCPICSHCRSQTRTTYSSYMLS